MEAYNTFLNIDPDNNLAKNERMQVRNNIFREKFEQIQPALRIKNWANCDIDPLSCKARLLAATLKFNKGNENGKNRNVKGLAEITEGIMIDERCIIMPNYLDLAINTAFEQNKALSPTLSVHATILRYKQKLAQVGWDSIFPALSTNICAAFLIGKYYYIFVFLIIFLLYIYLRIHESIYAKCSNYRPGDRKHSTRH